VTSRAQICPGSCNTAYRKAKALGEAQVTEYQAQLEALRGGDPVPDPPEAPNLPRPWWGDPVWCGRCQVVISRELAELDELASRIAQLPPGIRAAAESTREDVKVDVSRSPVSPSPAADTLDDLAGWLCVWEEKYRHLRGWRLAPPLRGHLADQMTAGIEWLGARTSSILAGPFGQPFGEETRRWHAALRALTHSASYARHVKKPCPKCKRYMLWERVGEDYISCQYEPCGYRPTREELNAATDTGAAPSYRA
jgi:hypothetical protein